MKSHLVERNTFSGLACLGLWGLCLILHLGAIQLLWAEFPAGYPRQADLGVQGIFLSDRRSAENILGKNRTLAAFPDGRFYLKCMNRDRSEILTLYQHRGAAINTFQEFKVESAFARFEPAECFLKDVERFISFRKVKLGMSLKEVIDIFGEDYTVQSVGAELYLQYAIDSNLHSKFLQSYQETRYYGRYFFRGGKLREYEFGFPQRP